MTIQTKPNKLLSDELYTRCELAAELKVSVRTLDRWHAMRIGPPRIKIGKSIFYPKDDVLTYLKGQTIHPPIQYSDA